MRRQCIVRPERGLVEQSRDVGVDLRRGQRRAHHDAFEQRSACHLFVHREIGQEAVVRRVLGRARVEAAVHGLRRPRAGPGAGHRGHGNVERDRLVYPIRILLGERAFVRVRRIEMRIGSDARRAEEPAHRQRIDVVAGRRIGAELDTGAQPSREHDVGVENRGLDRIGREKVVIERRVVILDRGGGRFARACGADAAERQRERKRKAIQGRSTREPTGAQRSMRCVQDASDIGSSLCDALLAAEECTPRSTQCAPVLMFVRRPAHPTLARIATLLRTTRRCLAR